MISEMEPLLDAPQELSLKAKEELHVLYGLPDFSLPETEQITPPSPTTSFRKANDYLKKMEQIGFLKRVDPTYKRKPFDHTKMIQFNAPKKKNIQQIHVFDQKEIKKLFQDEPYLHFWLTSEIVVKISKEISSIPYKDSRDRTFFMSKLIEKVVSIIRKEHASEPHKKSAHYMKTQMLKFVTSMQLFRKEMIVQGIAGNMINTKFMSVSLRDEFAEHIIDIEDISKDKSKYENAQNNDQPNKLNAPLQKRELEAEQRIIDGISEISYSFPPNYRLDPALFKDEGKNYLFKQLQESMNGLDETKYSNHYEQGTKVSINTTRPNSSEYKSEKKHKPRIVSFNINNQSKNSKWETSKDSSRSLSQSQVHFTFWESEDPLKNTRKGQSETTLREFGDLTHIDYKYEGNNTNPESTLDIDVPIIGKRKGPKAINVIPQNGPSLIENIWNTADMSEKRHTAVHDREMNDHNETSNWYSETQKSSSAYRYLMMHNPLLFGAPTSESQVMLKLETIWKSLGFSVQQRLEILAKYSDNPDESHRPVDTISFWESVVDNVKLYDHAYQNLKHFLQYEAKTSDKPKTEFERIHREYISAEENLQQVSNAVNTSFNDTVYVRRKSINELFQKRREKIQKMKIEQNI